MAKLMSKSELIQKIADQHSNSLNRKDIKGVIESLASVGYKAKPPKGRARWTLRLLENKVVELGIVDRASDSTIGRTLKKTFSSPIAASTGSSRRRPTARS
jgi:hypothetical protein